MITLLFATLVTQASAINLFKTDCARYLILPDPQRLEQETTDDLTFLMQVLKARSHMYGHPLDRVWAAFILNELRMREIIDDLKGQSLDAPKHPR